MLSFPLRAGFPSFLPHDLPASIPSHPDASWVTIDCAVRVTAEDAFSLQPQQLRHLALNSFDPRRVAAGLACAH
jgi:hypothetical protein